MRCSRPSHAVSLQNWGEEKGGDRTQLISHFIFFNLSDIVMPKWAQSRSQLSAPLHNFVKKASEGMVYVLESHESRSQPPEPGGGEGRGGDLINITFYFL